MLPSSSVSLEQRNQKQDQQRQVRGILLDAHSVGYHRLVVIGLSMIQLQDSSSQGLSKLKKGEWQAAHRANSLLTECWQKRSKTGELRQ